MIKRPFSAMVCASRIPCFGKLLVVLLAMIIHTDLYSGELIYRTYEPDYHIEGKKISSVSEDLQGFVLIGTQGAIYRFDGLQYAALPFPDSLRQYEVTSLYTKEFGLIAGLSNGSLIQYQNINYDPVLLIQTRSTITDIEKDKSGRIWVATYGNGIFVYQTQIKHYTTHEGLADNYVYSLQTDSSGAVWAGTDAGLVRCLIQDGSEEADFMSVREQLPDLIIHSLALDSQNRLWIGFNDAGVACYDIDKEQYQHIVSGNSVRNSTIVSLLVCDDYVWITSRSGSLFSCQTQTGVFREHTSNGLNPLPKRIHSMCESHLGGFWIAGDDNITWTPGRKVEFFTKANGESLGEVHALLADSKENLWFCTEKGLFRKRLNLLNQSEPELVFETRLFNKTFFTCLYEDSAGMIWVGTFDHGVMLLDPETGNYRFFDEISGLANNNVLWVSGQGNNIWLSTFGGISRIIRKSKGSFQIDRFTNIKGSGNNYIYQILMEEDGRIWFATDGNGVGYYENGQFEQLNDSLLNGKAVYSIAITRDKALWVAVADEGILRIKGDNIQKFGLAEGIGSLSVTSLIPTDENYLMAVNIHRIDLIDIRSGEVIQVGENFDLHDIRAGLNAFTQNKNGECWIGTQNGFIKISKASELADIRPILNLNNVLVNQEPIDTSSVHKLAFNENYLYFDYTGIWYPRPGDVRFKVKLEGQDKDWSYTRDHQISYSNLAPGNYRFVLLDASNANDNSAKLTYSFTVLKPFWLRWWFILSLIVMFSGMIKWFISWRVKKHKREQQFRNEKLESEYRNLRNQVNPHFLFNSFSTLIALIESDTNIAIDYVEKLSDYFRIILQYRDTELIPIPEELFLLETYIFLQQKRYTSGLSLSIELSDIVKAGRIPPMTLQMLAENALKHNVVSRQRPLNLHIECDNQYLIVSNNLQPKHQPEISTSLGLKNITERYRLFAGKEVEVVKTSDSFIVKLPLISFYDSEERNLLTKPFEE
jgi:ligand-binding sensor domain-containing protein